MLSIACALYLLIYYNKISIAIAVYSSHIGIVSRYYVILCISIVVAVVNPNRSLHFSEMHQLFAIIIILLFDTISLDQLANTPQQLIHYIYSSSRNFSLLSGLQLL